MDVFTLIILTLSSLFLMIFPVICWIDLWFSIPLSIGLPIYYLYLFIKGEDVFSVDKYPVYIIVLWLSIPFGFFIGLFFEIFLIPSFITGVIGSVFLY